MPPSPPSLRLATEVSTGRRNELSLLEQERDNARSNGRYEEAGKKQAALESLKAQEDANRIQALITKHQEELRNLEAQHEQEFRAYSQRADHEIKEVRHVVDSAELAQAQRHKEEREQFTHQCAEELVRPRWSKALLNSRVQEEHLIRQREFNQAAKVQAAADALEAREYAAAEAALRARQHSEEGKLLARQQREVEATRRKLSAAYDEKVIAQERELDKLQKRMQASRNALLRQQGQERLLLDQALKGWFNPRRVNLPPAPLMPPPSSVSPGVRVTLERPKRPETAPTWAPSPGRLVHQPSPPPSSAPTTSVPPTDADQWPDSPLDGQLHPRPRKPWETPSDASYTPPRGSPYNTRPHTSHNGMNGGSPGGLNRALQPSAGGMTVGLHSLQYGGPSPQHSPKGRGAGPRGLPSPPTTSSPSSPSSVSHKQSPAQVAGAQATAMYGHGNQREARGSPAAGQGRLTKSVLRTHTKVTTGSTATVLGSRTTDTSLPSRGAVVGGSSMQPSSGSTPAPQFVVLHK